MKNKSAQQAMGMSFKMIFAIFLIAIFVIFSFMTINKFLNIGKSANVGMFYEDFEGAINNALKSQSSQFEFNPNLPAEVKLICFANLSAQITNSGEAYDAIEMYFAMDANTFLVPPEAAINLEYKNIESLDIEEITKEQNPYCVNAKKPIVIKKDFYSRGVLVYQEE